MRIESKHSRSTTHLQRDGHAQGKLTETFTGLFRTILSADKDQSRKAAREVRKLLYSHHDGQYQDIVAIIERAPEEYAKIAEDFRQENFVMAISVLYFLHNRENDPDFLFPWLFGFLQHENGNIRHAAVRMFEHEIGPLTRHIRFPDEKFSAHHLPSEHADRIIFTLFANLNSLEADLWKPTYKRYKFVSSLPSGAYKSAQMVTARLADSCGKQYMARFLR